MIFSNFTKIIAGITFIGLATAACVDTPLPKNKPPVNYTALQPYNLDVADVLVVDDSQPNALTQEFAQKFSTTIDSELRKWLESRIHPSGPHGTYTIIIKDAGFTATPLPVKNGFESYFTRDQVARWDGFLNVLVSVDGNGRKLPPAEFTVRVNTSHTVPEEAGTHEKSQIYHSMLNELMTLYNKEAEKQTQTHFHAYFVQ